ncbi:hypothetical protein VT25_02995 [Photobacterium leiognathi subsp. mandapamensis]|nr:hypothetical protein VT25_02995 [Photobacterium leiognathi subsp. mandapamensis]
MRRYEVELKALEKNINRSKLIAVILVLVIPSLYGFWFGYINDQSLSIDSSFWGTFGDFIGGILNPIIALMAFYWLTMSVLIQKTELSETQKILAETEKSQREQAKTQEIKRFEDSFYSLLEQMNSVYSSLNTKPSDIKGVPQKSVIDTLYFNVVIRRHSCILERARVMRESKLDFNYLFRIIYHLLKFILFHNSDNKNVNFDELICEPVSQYEKFYSSIVRSFLNKKMIHLLAFNCIDLNDGHDFLKFKLLIERYELLEHFSFEYDWMMPLVGIYDNKAFGEHPKVKC